MHHGAARMMDHGGGVMHRPPAMVRRRGKDDLG
jgi:hypothetical protein